MNARLFQVSFQPIGCNPTMRDTVELFALNKEDAIKIVKECYRVAHIDYVTSNQDEFIPAEYYDVCGTCEDDSIERS